jgi:hypothetical protein
MDSRIGVRQFGRLMAIWTLSMAVLLVFAAVRYS